MSAQDIILRIRHPKGFSRLTVSSKDTVKILKDKISALAQLPVQDFKIFYDQSYVGSSQLLSPDTTSLSLIPKLKNGVELFLKVQAQMAVPQLEKKRSLSPTLKAQSQQNILSINCNHSLNQRCINCPPQNNPKDKEKDTKLPAHVNKCTHPPGGSCLNCVDTSKKDEKHEKNETQNIFYIMNTAQKWLCQHGPNGKCSHCIDADYISNIKHVSFTHFLDEKKLKCKGVHPPTAKCANCIPPSENKWLRDKERLIKLLKLNQRRNQRMTVELNCKNHEPWPKAMCNNCLPPNVVVYRQPYRHVDFAQFMNVREVSNFVQSWTQNSHAEQRVGFMYGYYAEDPNYKGGVRAIIEAIYEPPQMGDISGFQILEDENETIVNTIAEALTLEKIGWIFTTINHDTFLSSHELRMAAKFQEQHRVLHESGYPFSTFITTVLRTGKDNPSEIKPEVYMVSDQAQVLEKNNIFGDSERRKFMKIRESKDERDVLPSIIVSGKQVTEFEPDFLLVNVAHGHSNHNKFSIVKHADFPVENRQEQNPNEVKKYLQKFKNQKSWERYSDFHLLIYLAKLVDLETTLVIADAVAQEKDVPETCEELIRGIVGF